jgi:hypothetical protein
MGRLQLMEAERDSQTKNMLRLLSADPANLDPQTGVWSEMGVKKASQIDPFIGMQIAQQRAAGLKTMAEVQRMQRAQPFFDRVFGGGAGGAGQTVPLSGVAAQAAGGPVSREAGSNQMPSLQDIQQALLTGDPGAMAWGKGMLEAMKPTALRQGAPAIDITGKVIVPPTPSVPQGMNLTQAPGGGWQAGVVPGFGSAQTALSGIPNLSHALIPIKTSSGQDIQLTQPEYVAWQQTNRLPERYAGVPSPLPKNVPEKDRSAYESVLEGKTPTAYGGAPSAKPSGGLGTIGATQPQQEQIQQKGQEAANTEGGKEFISEMRQNYAKLRDVPATIENMARARALAASEGRSFMGPFGESKLAITKFFRANVPGMGNVKTEGVTSAEELQSTLFNQVMDNLKKMDASPSQYQQQVMQEAFGTLRTDPGSVPKILDVFEDILRNRVKIHNDTVTSAEGRGTAFPYDVNINLPAKGAARTGTPTPAVSGKKVKWSDL